jgi:UDP-N-acetyl-2-amino-2-deoxyglucuronate dehydrogenase
MAGILETSRARIRWFLSVDAADLPQSAAEGQSAFRSTTVNGEQFEFSDGFTDLHTASYEAILNGNGYGISDIRPSIEIVSSIRSATAVTNTDQHPLVRGLQ